MENDNNTKNYAITDDNSAGNNVMKNNNNNADTDLKEETEDDIVNEERQNGRMAGSEQRILYTVHVNKSAYENMGKAAEGLEEFLSIQPYRTLKAVSMLQYTVSQEDHDAFKERLNSALEKGLILGYSRTDNVYRAVRGTDNLNEPE